MDMIRVLFVCMGNICRSPMAEGLFLKKVRAAELTHAIEVASAGCGNWHAGERPDPRMEQVAAEHQVELPSRAREMRPGDLLEFDYILVMDQANHAHVQRMLARRRNASPRLHFMREFDPEARTTPEQQNVLDPYAGGAEGFLEVYRILDRSTEKLLAHLQQHELA